VPAITFSGLASGFDSSSIVDKLVAAEKAPEQTYVTQKTNASSRITVLNDLMARMNALQTTTGALDTADKAKAFGTTSSDASRVKIVASSAAQEGTYLVSVQSLARAQTSRSTSFASNAAPGAGSVSIAVGTGTPVAISYASGDTLDDIAARINDQVAGVSASVLDTGSGFRLVVSSTTTGTANAVTFAESGAGLGMTQAVAAQDATFTVNGTSVTRSSNTASDVIAGVTFQLQSVTPTGAGDTEVASARDASSTTTKVQGLVDAFNAVASAVAYQLTPASDKSTRPMFGDSMLQGLQRRLGGIVATAYTHGSGTVSARDLGITLNTDGTLAFDSTKLAAVAGDDPSAVDDLVSGLSAALSSTADDYTKSSTGVIAGKLDAENRLITGYDKQIQSIEDAATALGARLSAQFTALETLMSNLQAQSSYLTALTSSSSSA
jgi:flagellar hook-associated protein 2